MNHKVKNIFISVSLLALVVIPVFVRAADEQPLVSGDCGVLVNGVVNRECDYTDLMKLVDRVIGWIIMVSVPVAAGIFAWAGFKYMTTGVSDQKSAAKAMLWKVFWGFVFILSAYLIVETILKALT
jgi:hypothetical protein